MQPPMYDGQDAALFYASEEIERVRTQRDDLLAACEEMLDYHGWVPDGAMNPSPIECDCNGCKQARAAIARARGEGE